MKKEEITTDKLEEWVRSRFKGHAFPDHKYPVSYGIYDSDREELHKRNISFYEEYKNKTASDIEFSLNFLQGELEKHRIGIYDKALAAIKKAKMDLEQNKFEAFKDIIILWILARVETGSGLVKLSKDVFKPINLSEETNKPLKDPKLIWGDTIEQPKYTWSDILEGLNAERFNWVNRYEALQVAKFTKEAKVDPSIKDWRYGMELKADGEGYAYLESIWESKDEEKERAGYGAHQEREEWVKNEWFKIREKKNSDRKADLALIDAYKEKYNGEIISTSTIQRFTGRQKK